MKKTILTFGLISGVLASVMMCATAPFLDQLGHGSLGLLVGYTTIVLSFLLVYFGIRSYRDNVGHGHITFARAFTIGLAITLISCAFYVVTWEILYFTVLHGFMDNYGAHALANLKASGASPEVIQAQTLKLQRFKQQYENPFYNAAMTFIEPFPVGLIMTLLSSLILRKKPRSQSAPSALPAAS
jgi:hypothetical protein